jgi:hypothetical protein
MLKRSGLIIVALSAVLTAGSGVAVGKAIASPSVPAARAVALSDATAPPTTLTLLRPGRSTTWQGACLLSDASAYGWRGEALGAQRWVAHRTVMTWRGTGGRVTFDGVAFRNHTRAAVIVAGWC